MFKIKYPSLFVGGAVLIALFGFSVLRVLLSAPAFKISSKPQSSILELAETITVPERIKDLINSGLKAYRRGYFDAAKVDLESASFLARSSLTNVPMIALVDSYIVTGDYQRSIGILESLLSRNPNSATLYSKLGLAFLLNGKHLEAVDSFEHALELDENERTAMLYLGLAYKQMGNDKKMEEMFNRAREQFNQILLINEEDLDTIIQLASLNIYWNINQQNTTELLLKAKDVAEKRRGDLSVNLISRFYLPLLEGIFNHQIGKYHESLIKLTISLQGAPQGIHYDLAKIYYYIGKNYIQLLEPAQAKKFYVRAVEVAPKFFYSKEMQKFIRRN